MPLFPNSAPQRHAAFYSVIACSIEETVKINGMLIALEPVLPWTSIAHGFPFGCTTTTRRSVSPARADSKHSTELAGDPAHTTCAHKENWNRNS